MEHGNRKYSLNSAYFEDVRSPEQAYWLGFITADGCITDRNGTHALRIDLKGGDAPHLRLFLDALNADHPVTNYRGGAQVAINSVQLISNLVRLGVIERKSLIVEPWHGPDGLAPHYWRGFFDGNGTIFSNKKGWSLAVSGSRACVAAFGNWGRDLTGSRAQPRHARKGSDCWQWGCQGSEKSQLLAMALYQDAPVALKRKQLLAQELCAIDFAAQRIQENAKRAATMRDAWATGRHPRAKV